MNHQLEKPLPAFLLSICLCCYATAQHSELSFHLDPHLLSETKLEVTSPIISETAQLACMAGATLYSVCFMTYKISAILSTDK